MHLHQRVRYCWKDSVCVLEGNVLPKDENSVIIFSPSCWCESPEALRSQMNLRRCYLQPLHMLRAYWGLFPAADEYTFGALVVVMKEYVAQCSSVALLCVVNSFFLTTTEFSYFSNTDFTVCPQSCMKSSAILLEVQTQRCLFWACKENMELIFCFWATFVDWRIVPTKSLVTFS